MNEQITPAEAAAALARAATARVVSAADVRALTAYLVGLGAGVAGVLAGSWWMLSHENVVGFAAVMGGYGLVLALLIGIQRRARSTPRGFKRIYMWGFGATMALYVIGVMWFSFTRPGPSAAAFLPYSLLVALPAWIAAMLVRRAAR